MFIVSPNSPILIFEKTVSNLSIGNANNLEKNKANSTEITKIIKPIIIM